MSLTGYEAFQIYSSLKLHFTTDYDYFKYNGKSKVSVESYEKNKARYHFQKLSRIYPDKDSLVNFLVSNFIKNPKLYVLDLFTEESKDTHLRYDKYFQALSYNFSNDCDNIFTNDPRSAIKTSGEYPELLQKMLHGDIHFQTLCILSEIIGFLDYWESKIKDDFSFPSHAKTIKKYSKFISEEDIKKCRKILKEKLK